MAFTNDQVGIERGATQLLLDREPRVLSRFSEGGPERAAAVGITGMPFITEYVVSQDRRTLVLALESMTAAQMSTLRDLMDDTGVVTVKTATGTSDTEICSFAPAAEQLPEPIIGYYTENAPTSIKRWRAEIKLYIQE